jgi:flagellar motility protein MotE (MotC chaperone)
MVVHCKMFTIQVSASKTFSKKKFKKFGKKLRQERREDLRRMSEKFKDITKDEERRMKDLFKQHREFFEEKQSTSIDFYEK